MEAQRDVTRTLSDIAAEEIRALLGRRRMSQAELARRLDVTGAWLNYRLTGRQPIDLNDLQVIAVALDVQPSDLLGANGTTRQYGHKTAKDQVKAHPVTRPPTRSGEAKRSPSHPPSYPQSARRPQLLGHHSKG